MSCETQLIEAMNDWTSALNEGGGQVDIILLDFSKAFDVVPHQRLLSKLYMYGVSGKTLGWIQGFLGNRTQEVVVNGSHSSKQPVKSGVPQGTVLGPLLFLLYINDIEENIESSIRLFADDSALYRNINTPEDSKILQKDLFNFQKWANNWQMVFNIEKCKVLRISYRKSCKVNAVYKMYKENASGDPVSQDFLHIAFQATGISMSNSEFCDLEEITSARYLGVILDSKLNFNAHVDEITKKATKLLNLCCRNLHMCSAEVKTMAYNSIVRPHLEYASGCWNPHTKSNIDKVEAVQRRAARFVLNYYDYSPNSDLTGKIQNTLKWPPLQHRRAINDLCLFYKIRNSLVNISFPSIVAASTRHVHRFNYIQSLHSEAYKYQFFVRTVRLWNVIPDEVIIKPSVDSFKNGITQWIAPQAWIKNSATNTWGLSTSSC